MTVPPNNTILYGDARVCLQRFPERSVQVCVTSPPYFRLRDYFDSDLVIGMEASPDAYVAAVMDVLAQVHRILRDDGLLFLNVGDCYATYAEGTTRVNGTAKAVQLGKVAKASKMHMGVPYKGQMAIPERFKLALMAHGWLVRQTVIWRKPNPVPESVRDRPCTAHETIFIASKRPNYFWDAEAAREPAAPPAPEGTMRPVGSVWSIPTQPYRGPVGAPHRPPMPFELATRCIRYGSREGDRVLDPFMGTGTVAAAADNLGRFYWGVELDPGCESHVRHRTRQQSIWSMVHQGAQSCSN